LFYSKKKIINETVDVAYKLFFNVLELMVVFIYELRESRIMYLIEATKFFLTVRLKVIFVIDRSKNRTDTSFVVLFTAL
jgi:hypothetical protein